jgi:hypothetical protein
MFAFYATDWEEFRNTIIARWTASFTGATGAVLPDLTGNGYNINQSIVAEFNTVWKTEEQNLAFEQTSNGQNSTTRAISIPASSALSASFWFKPTLYQGSNPGVFRSSSGTDTFFIIQGATGLPWIRRSGADILKPTSGTAFNLGEWQHCIFAMDTRRAAIYKNGKIIHSANHTTTGAAFSFSVLFRQGNEIIRGFFDDVFFSNQFIDTQLSQKIYEQGRGGGLLMQPPLRRSYFVPALPSPRRRSSRALAFPG